MGLRVWSGGEIFGKKKKKLWEGTKGPPPPSKVRLIELAEGSRKKSSSTSGQATKRGGVKEAD